MNKMHRAQILLEPEQHQALAEIARQEGRSISGLVREAIRIWLSKRERDAQRQSEMQALEELTHIRRRIQEQRGIYQVDLLSEARAERGDDIERVWGGET